MGAADAGSLLLGALSFLLYYNLLRKPSLLVHNLAEGDPVVRRLLFVDIQLDFPPCILARIPILPHL